MHIRTSISLPKTLKARMDQVDQPVNWSRVAVQAFEAKLHELAKEKEVSNMEAVVQRLRVSKMTEEDSMYRDGLEKGRNWAKQSASWSDLSKIDEHFDQYGADDWGELEASYSHISPGALFLSNMDPERFEGEWNNQKDFWEDYVPDGNPSATFVHGFCTGAVQVFDKVQEQL